MPYCTVCHVSVDNRQWSGHLRSNAHKNNSIAPFNSNVKIIKSSFKGRIVSYRIIATEELVHKLPESFLNKIRDQVKDLIDQSLKRHTSVKVNFELFLIFLLFKNDHQETKSFATKNFIINFNYDFDTIFKLVISLLLKRIEEFQERDSGWTFLNNSYFEVNINKYQPLSGSKFIPLPSFIKNKKACLNIKNNDKYCFLWCVVAGLYPATRHADRVSSYPRFQDVLNVNDLSFPITFTDIANFEKNNRNINIYVYGLKNNKTVVGPLYKTINKKCRSIHLLYLENDSNSHYCLIKNLPRLVRSQISKHHGKLYYCESCLLFFPTLSQLETHLCGGVVTILPDRGSVLKFKNFQRKQDIPFVVYADFETLLIPISSDEYDTVNTTYTQRHAPAAFAYNIVSSFNDNDNKRYRSYRGKDCVAKFIEFLTQDVIEIYKILTKNNPMIFTDKDVEDFRNAIKCHICENLLWSDRVRDHCHITGKYRGAAHRHCNLQHKVPKFIPIFFHNLSGYDCHLFVKKLGEIPGQIKIIPKTKEKYISFSKFIPVADNEYVQLRFLDSFNFLGTSLDKLAKTMQIEDFVNLRSHFSDNKHFSLLTRKGVYPYDYMTNWKCYEQQALPLKCYFHNSLTNEDVSDDDYNHAKTVWNCFNINNLGEYTDLYLKTDVLLLTDIFQNFRKTCKQYYKLDPAFYITTPSLSFDAMLLKTGVQLELLTDLAIIKMIQDGIRGGLCVCSHRYAKANHKYMPEYNAVKPDCFITYLDCNNLYGYSMCQYLPHSSFRFLNDNELKHLRIQNIDDDADWGYILEVDLLYPDHLHNYHNDLPFCPEKCIPPGGKTKKLIANLYNKYNYVIHYVHLKKCLEHGLILRKIHRVITFKQSPYLKQYIELNTQLRQKAKSTFEQDFFKLLNNSVFGKTLENTEKRVTVHLVNQWSDKTNKTNKTTSAERLIANPYFHSSTILTENLVAIQMKPDQIILDKPIYIGFTVLDLSKSHMYNFHYNVIKPFYNDRVRLCYTDTDSFVYEIYTNDFYCDLKHNFLEYFDSSNYNNENEFAIPLINKKIPGLFKDEMGGEYISEFVGLRSKLYSLKCSNTVIKKAKGIKSYVLRDLDITDYERILLNGGVIRRKNIMFKSLKHEIFTQSVNKITLSSNDDKRIILKDKIATKAWGHSYTYKM